MIQRLKEYILKKYSVIIADKIEANKLSLNTFLKEYSNFEAIALAFDFHEAINIINSTKADILFINDNLINEPSKLIELIDRCPEYTQIVYMGDDVSLAMNAIEYDLVDFILFPCTPDRFKKCIHKLSRRLDNKSAFPIDDFKKLLSNFRSTDDTFIVKDSGKIKVIDPSDIIWVGGAGNYVELHLQNEERPILHRETLSVMESTLKTSGFIRIHRSTLVRKRFISELKPTESGDYHVTLKNGQTLSLSRRFKSSMSGII